MMQTEYGIATRGQKQSCTDVSCSGAALWNLTANEALSQQWPDNVYIQAYADDFIILLASNTKIEKEELQGMLPVDGRQLENVKGELLKLKKKETADCNYGTTCPEEWKKQKNKEIADCQTWHNVARTEEQKKQKNKEIDDWQ
ncbi:hypothetical protein AVEN_17756-1 [Araneus ventricosus]|uniref:Reverse transcriptase domain-containing protein n=1 Tax=Araneus ventricosus TaxID=182803 RepID=A0A4Y2W4X1_ARAVE|nr:hypothetical protein AVEN_17756-1 [Araneus ventricosus]